MPYFFKAQRRLTSTYIDQLSHLDQWGEEYTFKALGSILMDLGNGYDTGSERKFTVVGDKHKNQNKQALAIGAYFGHSGCTHEYDCCGCESIHAYVRMVKPGHFAVTLSSSYNY